MANTPMETGPSFLRGPIATVVANALGSATVAPDFAANTLVTILGGAAGAGLVPGFWCTVEKLRLIVGNTDFAGAAGTLTFSLRRDSETGTEIATLTVTLATALRGTVLEASVTAANDAAARLKPTDKLYLVRTATGTAFTTGDGTWQIIARQRPQSRAA